MGGTEKLLVSLLNHLVKENCEITLLLPEPSKQDVLLKNVDAAVSVKYLYPHSKSHFRRKIEENIMIFFPGIFNKMKGIKAEDYDEVVCFKETFYARIFSKLKVHKILWIHNILYKRKYEVRSFKERVAVWLNKKQLRIVQKSYDRFSQIICVSNAARDAYINVLHDGISPKQDIRILYNAIDLSELSEKAKEPITELSQGQTNFILLTRTSPEKRIDRMIHASARLKEEGYDFHVYIVGEGTDSSDMHHSLKEFDISDKVTLVGRLENPFPYVLQCKWSLCVSERESFSLALLESMALKTPVITTDCGGPRDIVDGGKYGLLVDNSTEGVYQGMKSVLDNPGLSVRYSVNLDEAVSRFSFQGWLQNVYKLLSVESI